MSRENVEVVRRAMATFARTRDFGPLLASDAKLVNAPGTPFTVSSLGAAGVREWLRDVDEAFGEWGPRLDAVIDAPGDKVVVLNHFRGRGRGKGAEVEMELDIVYTVASGKIIRIEGYMTRAEALEAAGLSES
jgi:ketosteroid isomerase-like protein